LRWDSGPLIRSDDHLRLDGVFPAITCSQMGFLKPWTPANGSFEHSNQSLIILKMMYSSEKSVGTIKSQGWFTTLANEQLYVVITREYSFDSGIS